MIDLRNIMEGEFDMNQIKPLVSNDILKIVLDEIDSIMLKLSFKYSLPISEIRDYIKDDLNKVGIKLGLKKRNRRVLPPDKQCMGRKLDSKQCTRGRYKEGSEFCKSHDNKLPLGRIDDEYVQKEPSQRGRKKKNSKKSSEYILTRIKTIGEINYLVDDRNFVYSFDTNNPRFLGIKVDNTLKSLDSLGIKVG